MKEISKKYKIDVMCLAEPRISGVRADHVCKKLSFSNWVRVEVTGYAGGIWVLWNIEDVKLVYLSSSTQMAHCEVLDRISNKSTYVTFIYKDTSVARRN